MSRNSNIKANKIFTKWRQVGWLLTLLVAFGGLYEPKLGLIVPFIIIGLIGTSFFKGRLWCGHVCAHGSLYDSILLKYSRNTKIPKFFRSKILMVAFFLWMGTKMSYKTYIVFSNFEGMQLLDKFGFIFVSTYIMVFIISVPLALIFTPRTWCQFCPMGTMQKASSKLGEILGVSKKTNVKISVASKDLCHECGKCSRVCPMQLTPYVEFDENNQFSNANCIKCNTCVNNCPANILSLSKENEAIENTKEIESKHKLSKIEVDADIKKISYLQPDVMEIIFDLGENDVNYTPGQFALVKIEENTSRAYTISGFDKAKNEMRITIKKVSNGYGTGIIFDTFKEDMKVSLKGPMGHELIVDKSSEKILLLSAGIGITPFVPILKDLSESGYEGEVRLVHGARYKNELYYLDEINEVVYKNENINFIPVLSREKDFDGAKGYITDIVKDLDLNDTKIYMCSSPQVAKSIDKLLDEKGFDKDNFCLESA